MKTNLFGVEQKAPFMGQKVKAETVEWGTPQKLFDKLNSIHNFTLDPCASDKNHKCDKYYTREINGLTKSWAGETVFCNPPYGRDIYDWAQKCYYEWKENNITIVMLIPARTDTKWFHDFIYHKADIEFIKGRLAYESEFGNSLKAPFPSMIVTFKKRV